VDLSCDVLDVDVAGGITSAQGIFSKADALTLTAHLLDPEGIYDPVNPIPPWTFQGQSRLVPGTPVEAFAEVVDPADASWTRILLFAGTADSWGEPWTPNPRERVAELVATDATKGWVNLNRPEQPPAGAGDNTATRVARIATFYGWAGGIEAGTPAAGLTYQATTFDAQGWELLNETMDQELGVIHFTPEGKLRWVGRDVWLNPGAPVIAVGCPPEGDPDAAEFFDVVIDAQPSAQDSQLRNDIYAQREGGAVVHAASTASIARHGRYEYTRTDLTMETDPQAGDWANAVLRVNAYPRQALETVTLRPEIAPNSWDAWREVLGVRFFSDVARVVWIPPDNPARVVDTVARVVGFDHRISRDAWEVDWQLIGCDALATKGWTFHLGPNANDRLDAGFVLA
jgi:hypothetical protein